MAFDFGDILNILDGEDFSERPVSIKEFVQSEDFLGLPPLSENQYLLIRASSQIYNLKTLVALYGEEAGRKRFEETKNEIIFQLGKGSGKGYTSSIACAYVVYLLLCLKDPAKYYGKPPGDHIAILNIAINAAQAQNVFFKYFKQRITSSPWFIGKYTEKSGEFQFDKNVFVYSGHSEREAWEGYNVIFVILDEISGFALDSTSGSEQSKTASAVYKMYKQSVTSRFPEFGKLVLLSFPRFKNDFIQQRYDEVIADKEVLIRKHRFKLNPDLPDGHEGNEFEIEWEEDHIVSYKIPKVYALKRPTWEINPLMDIDKLAVAFYDDPLDALSRFACMPPDAIDAFFKDRGKVERAFNSNNGTDLSGVFYEGFKPDPSKRYFVHVDLARVHDHAAVAMAHVEKWEQRSIGTKMTEPAPVVIVDSVRYWTPSKTKNVDFTEIREYILSLKRRGFDIRLVTFDRWESADTMKYLNDMGLKSERLSVAKKHYEDFAMVVAEERLVGPRVELLIDEMLQLRIMKNDRVDHPRKGCFVGDTRIPLLDGTRPMISELAGKEVWVYSAKEDGTIVPGRARGRYTKHVDELIDVVLDSGAVVRCTPDHPWMLRNGGYKEAQHLRPGIDRLMPINQVWPVNGGYERVTDKNGIKTLTHHMVVNGMGEPIPDGYIVHHKNHIKTDNRPENLAIESLEEHSRHHTAGRHDDEDYRAALYAGLRRFNSEDSTRAKRSENMKSRPNSWYLEKARASKTFRADITVDSLLSIKDDPEAINSNAAARILGCGRNVVMRVLREHGYSSWEEFVTDSGENHKVRSIIWVKLDKGVPVYDLEVDDFHNFALSAGVFVHNSKDLADAVCGAIFNAIAHTPRESNQMIEVKTLQSVRREIRNEIVEPKKDGVIRAPKQQMPKDLEDYLTQLRVL